MSKQTAQKIHKALTLSNRVLLIPHQHPDGDAVGAVGALAHMLYREGIHFDIYCLTNVPSQYDFAPYAHRISSDVSLWKHTYDAIVVCDSGDPTYAGIADKLTRLKNAPTIINIDHHASNTFYGDFNLVNSKASSTTEILYHYFKINNVDIDGSIATSLFMGLIYDTGNFSNRGTSDQALGIASKLVQKGANIHAVRKHLINNKPVAIFPLWSRVLSRIEEYAHTQIIYTFITQQDLRECDSTDDDVSGIANLLNDLSDGKASMVLREREDGSIKGSLRTTHDDVDVSTLAQAFGGGGHKKASGFTLTDTIENSLNTIWTTLDRFADNGYTI